MITVKIILFFCIYYLINEFIWKKSINAQAIAHLLEIQVGLRKYMIEKNINFNNEYYIMINKKIEITKENYSKLTLMNYIKYRLFFNENKKEIPKTNCDKEFYNMILFYDNRITHIVKKSIIINSLCMSVLILLFALIIMLILFFCSIFYFSFINIFKYTLKLSYFIHSIKKNVTTKISELSNYIIPKKNIDDFIFKLH